MRNLIYLLFSFTLFIASSCKKESYSSATVIKDCTGTYLRLLDKDYLVCNADKTAAFANEEKVLASFNLIKQCNSSEAKAPTCFMLHPNAGWINIIDIKKLP